MKKMILSFLMGALIFSSITSYAYTISSSDVSYKSDKPEFTATNVESALNTLYDRSGNISDRIDGTYSHNKYTGPQLSSSGTTLTLSKGNYYVLMDVISAGMSNAIMNSTIKDTSNGNSLLSHNGAECEIINNELDEVTGNTKSDSIYFKLWNMKYIYKCSVETSATFSNNVGSDAWPASGIVLSIDAIKID